MTYRRSSHPCRSISVFDESRGIGTDAAAKWLKQNDPKLNRSQERRRQGPKRRRPEEGAHT